MEITGIKRITDRLSAAPAWNYAARDAERLADEVPAAGAHACSMDVSLFPFPGTLAHGVYGARMPSRLHRMPI